MAKLQITPVKRSEVKKEADKPKLPDSIVTCALVELNGVQGIQVTQFAPLPEDEQIPRTERKGKRTVNKETGEVKDNRDKIVSSLAVYGRIVKADLVYIGEDGEEYALTDGNGTQIQFSGKLVAEIRGEGAPDEDEEEEEEA